MLIDVQGLVVGQRLLVSLDVVKDCVFVFFLHCEVKFVLVIVNQLLDVHVISLRSLYSDYGFLSNLIWRLNLKLFS